MRAARSPWTVAAAGLALALAWQLFLVHGLYQGRWSGLFYTGTEVALPPALAGVEIARAPDPIGFDGQYYRFIAHDPWLATGARAYVDNPPLRWRRILAPALAWAAAGGNAAAVDGAFIATILAFAALGVGASARFVAAHGLSPWLGLAFLALPATYISVERMTVDVALAALVPPFSAFVAAGQGWRLYALLAVAPLARETGVALAGAVSLVALAERRLGRAVAVAVTLAPFVAWAAYVHSRVGGDSTAWFGAVPLGGLARRTLDPFPEAATGLGLRIAGGLEFLGILGVWAAFVLIALELRRRPRDPLVLAAALTAALFAFLAKEDIWQHAYGYARTMSPVLLLLALAAVRDRRPVLLLPWASMLPRIAFQVAVQALSVLRSG